MEELTRAEIQLTSNVVIASPRGKVLLTRYDADDERLWIPGASLEDYEHPDAAAIRAVAALGLKVQTQAVLSHVESFRGRRGWHVMFNYLVQVDDELIATEASWFDALHLPQTAHGEWEKGVIARALAD